MPRLHLLIASAILAGTLTSFVLAGDSPGTSTTTIKSKTASVAVPGCPDILADVHAFATLDRDRDGLLTPQEIGPQFCAMFPIIDLNGDGFVSKSEYMEHAQRRSLIADIVKAYMLRWDKDRDGLLQREEFVGSPAAFVYADQDENNVLHNAELMRLIGSDMMIQYDPEQFFRAHDLDADGIISASEWRKIERSGDLFTAMDYSGNCVLTFGEVHAFLYRYERRLSPLAEMKGKTTRTIINEEKPGDFLRSSEGQG